MAYDYEEEIEAREKASKAFHDNPSNPSDCLVYAAFYKRNCPCESEWRKFMPKKGDEE